MGPTGSMKDIEELAHSLEAEGCSVQTFASMPVEVSLSKFDMAVLVVNDTDPSVAAATEHRIQRTLHAAGFLEARLSRGKVCLLVEDTVDRLEAPPVTQIRYPSGRPMEARDEIVNFLSTQYPQVSGELHRHVPIRQQVQSSDLRLGWAMLAAVFLIALIPLILIIRGLGGGSETVELDDVASSLGSEAPAGPELDARAELEGDSELAGTNVDGTADGNSNGSDSDGDDGSTALLPSTSTTAPGNSTGAAADDSTDGTGGETTDTTPTPSGVTLPATCTIDVRKSFLLTGTIDCPGGGRLAVEGHEGPWHNDIMGIALSAGVSGTVTHEPRSDGTTVGPQVVTLTAGAAKNLNPEDAAFGVNVITAVFGADGQHVHIYESEDDGGRQATLTFTVASP